MSRIGKKPIQIPDKVKVEFTDGKIIVRGPKGELSFSIPDGITFKLEGNVLTFERTTDDKKTRALHGLTRAYVNNMIIGVTQGFEKTLLISGIGYKAEMKNKGLLLSLGYSHPIFFIPPDGVTLESPNPTTILVKGIDKQAVGEVAAKIKKLRPVEPYKGKGIFYQGQFIRRKAGKSGTK
ncbi:MAG: 50S ribosomal protein L6 [Candidatus Kapaibacteriota bacterium]